MTRPEVRRWRQAVATASPIGTFGLALLAYVPFLLSSPGRVSGDSEQYLYLDPARFLARVPYLWDPQVAAGTVPHQQLGFLFPMGPWFWVMDEVGVPAWVAQRLWLGTISLAAALGARWLFRMLGASPLAALAGALVYVLSPYQLAFTARISALLLPWAALPWLVGLTMRAIRRGGWRDPALFALVLFAVGGINASSLLLAGIGPVLVVVLELFLGRRAALGALVATARIGVLSLGVSVWWVVGLRLQGAYGLPVLQLTENLREVAKTSSPDDVLRGLGNWFFYGQERLGFSIDQARAYLEDPLVVLFSFAVPVVALLAAAVVRWRHRTYFALLVIVGAVVAVGAWPYDEPTPLGEVWQSFAEDSSIGLALRNTPRVVPVVILGLGGLLAAGVTALPRVRVQRAAATAVALLAVAALYPVWHTGYLSDGVDRPSQIPRYWTEAAAALDTGGDSTRALEIPGSNFAAYRWGNTIDPVTPGLTDRPSLAREVLPYGSPQLANLLDALDRRFQEGTFEPASLAPLARLLGVGTVVLRSDLQYERFLTPRPRLLWAQLTEPVPPGLGSPDGFGEPVRNQPVPQLPVLDELTLRTPADAPDPPPVALFDVQDEVPIVHTAPASQPVVLAGDGDGIVDAAAAGLLDGDALVLTLASLGDDELARALDAEADLVLTDSNRRRVENWFFAIRDTQGATERAGQTLPDPNNYDFRLDVFPGATDATRTVVEHDGGRVDATSDGGAPRPEDRAVRAYDGDVRTSWRVGGFDPTVHEIVLQTERPVEADQLTLVQPLDGPRDRVLKRVRLVFDEGDPVTVALGPESLTPEGQVVPFPARTVNRLAIDLLETTVPSFDPALANAVGLAEVRLGDVQVRETVRLPVDLVRRVGGAAEGQRLDVVMTRLRYEPSESGRQDAELALDRRFVLPGTRAFALSGTARVNPDVADHLLDRVLGTEATGAVFTASSHLPGDLGARASRAYDGEAETAWTTAIGAQEGQWLQVSLPARVTVDEATITVVADGLHSVPTRLRIEADGNAVRTLDLPEITDAGTEGSTTTVPVTFEPVTGRELRLVVESVRPGGRASTVPTLPVALADVDLAGVPEPAPAERSERCRDDLLAIDGDAVGIRVVGPAADARAGLTLEACDGPLRLVGGSHRLTSATGLDIGIDVDRVVLASDAVGPRGASLAGSGATVEVEGSGPTSFDLEVETDGEPFWLVLGQSHSKGWEAEVEAGSIGDLQVVDGYANGWLVRPESPGTLAVELEWAPQRLVWVGLAVSAVAVLVCAAIVVVTSRGVRRRPAEAALAEVPVLVGPLVYAGDGRPPWAVLAAAGAVALGAAALSRPWIGLASGASVVLGALVPRGRPLLILAVPVALALSRITHRPELAWCALALLAADLALRWLRYGTMRTPTPVPSSFESSTRSKK